MHSLLFLLSHTQQHLTPHPLSTGAIPQKSRGHPLPVPPDPHVHLRIRLLLTQEQPVGDLRGQPARPRVGHGDAQRVSREGYH